VKGITIAGFWVLIPITRCCSGETFREFEPTPVRGALQDLAPGPTRPNIQKVRTTESFELEEDHETTSESNVSARAPSNHLRGWAEVKLLTSLIKALPLQFVILAPPTAEIPESFRAVEINPRRHKRLLYALQRLRGNIYLSDGAIQRWQLTRDGRHEQPFDFEGWHLVALDGRSEVCGCVRYREHANTVAFHQLGIYESTFASQRDWGRMLQHGIERELIAARRTGVAYAEVGGWAIIPERRHSPEALRIALTTYAVAEALGGARGITTATVRHHSSSILRRLGGKPLQAGGVELPPYYDFRYRCEMEVLQFDSRSPSLPYRGFVEEIRAHMPQVTVLLGEGAPNCPAVPSWISDRASRAARASRAWAPA
jgi:hypothetical protein